MKQLTLLIFLITSAFMSAQWPLYDIGTTLEVSGVHIKEDGTILLSGGMGMMKKSTDCGEQWTDIPTGYLNDLGKFQFIDGNVGYVLADDGQYGKTTDGGESWMFYATPAPDDLEALYFLDEMNGYFVGKDGGIIHTMNGGTTWTLMTSGTTKRLQGVYFTDELNGIVTGRDNTLLHTIDGGQTWAAVAGVSGDLGDVAFSDEVNGIICGEGGIYRINADLSLIEYMSLGALFEFSDVHFVDENVGWICGEPGVVFVTNNGGDSWQEIVLDGDPFELSSIYGRSLNSVFTVGDIGKVNGLCSPTDINEFTIMNAIEVLTINETEILIQIKELFRDQTLTITLYALNGSTTDKIKTSPQSGKVISMQSPEAAGIYVLSVEGEKIIASQKVIIQ